MGSFMTPDSAPAPEVFPARVRSAGRVVVLPTLVFLALWAGVPILAHALGARGTGVILGMVGLGFGVALAASVGIQRVLGPGPGSSATVSLAGGLLRWRRHTLRLDAPHRAVLRLDARSSAPSASLVIEDGRRRLSLFARPVDPSAVARAFPADGFALDGALGPEEGLPAWVVGEDALRRILGEVWRHRGHNGLFQLFERLSRVRTVPRSSPAERTLPFASPEVQAELAQALYELKPGEIWLTPSALLFREEGLARMFSLGGFRVASLGSEDSALQWYRIGDKGFWLDPGEAMAEVERVFRFVNGIAAGP